MQPEGLTADFMCMESPRCMHDATMCGLEPMPAGSLQNRATEACMTGALPSNGPRTQTGTGGPCCTLRLKAAVSADLQVTQLLQGPLTVNRPYLAASISAVLPMGSLCSMSAPPSNSARSISRLPSLAASQALIRGSGSLSLSGTEPAALSVSPGALHSRKEHTADGELLLMIDVSAAAEGDE